MNVASYSDVDRSRRSSLSRVCIASAAFILACSRAALADSDCDAQRARLGAPAVALYVRAHALGEAAQTTSDPRTYAASSGLFVRVLGVAEAKHLRADCLAAMYEDASFVAFQGGAPELGLREIRRDLALQPPNAPLQDRAEKQAFLGLELAAAGHLDKSVVTDRGALALFESEPKPDPTDLVAIRNSLGTSLLRVGQYDESARVLGSIATVAPTGELTVHALTVASAALRLSGRVADGDRSLDAALAAAGNDAAQKAFVFLWRAQYRIADERYVEAESDLNAILTTMTDASPNSAVLRGAAEGALANVYLYENRITDSQAAFARARADYATLPIAMSQLPLAAMSEAQATLSIRFGRYDEARRTIAQELPMAKRASSVLFAEFGGGNPIVAELETIDGVAALGNRRFVDSEGAFDRALKTMLGVSRTSALGATALLDRSIAKRLARQFRSARIDLYAAHAMLGNAPNGQLAGQLDFNRAILDYDMHDDRDGAAAFAAAFDDLEREYAASFAVLGERERLAFVADTERVVDGYLTFAIERPRIAGLGSAAFDVALFRKGLVARSIAALQARVRRSDDPAVAHDFDDLIATKKELAAIGTRSANPDRAARAAALQAQSESLQTKLAARFPDLAGALAARAPHASDVRAALHPGDAAVEIVRFDRISNRETTGRPWYVAIVLRADRPQPFVVELGSAAAIEGPALAAFRQIGLPPDARRSPSDARPLSRLAWEPIANAVVGARTVYLSGDGVLGTVAFDALQNGDGSLVADRTDGRIVLVDTTSDLGLAPKASTANTALLFGDPRFDLSAVDQRAAVARLRGNQAAPAVTLAAASHATNVRLGTLRSPTDDAALEPLADTGDEVRGIARQLRAHHYDARTYTGADALEETLEAQAHGERVVHLATHGAFLRDVDAGSLPATLPSASSGRLVGTGSDGPMDPPPLPDAVVGAPENDPMLRSLLFFAGADRAWAKREAPPADLESGVLTAAEASTLDLQGTELVVLSACETGLGSVRSGDGVIGLRRALRQAGARDVMMSLWRLPDRETSELMAAFYEHWLDGSEAHEALRAAEHDERAIVLKRYGSADPYYWAGLIVVGPPSHS